MKIKDYFIYYCKDISYKSQIDLLFGNSKKEDIIQVVQYLPQPKNPLKKEITVLFLNKKLIGSLYYSKETRPKVVKYIDNKTIMEYINKRKIDELYVSTVNIGDISYMEYVEEAKMRFNDFLSLLYYIILYNECNR